MEYTVKQGSLTPQEFAALFTAVGWTPPGLEQIRAALQNSLAVFSVSVGNRTIGMARLVGDGAMTFLRQYRTKIVRVLRSQIFRQIVQ